MLPPGRKTAGMSTRAMAFRWAGIDLSQEEVPDSCTIFAPDDPTTAALLSHVLEDEAKLDMPQLLESALAKTLVINPNTLNQHLLRLDGVRGEATAQEEQ